MVPQVRRVRRQSPPLPLLRGTGLSSYRLPATPIPRTSSSSYRLPATPDTSDTPCPRNKGEDDQVHDDDVNKDLHKKKSKCHPHSPRRVLGALSDFSFLLFFSSSPATTIPPSRMRPSRPSTQHGRQTPLYLDSQPPPPREMTQRPQEAPLPFPLCNGRRTDTGKRSPLCSGRWDGRRSSGRHTTLPLPGHLRPA